MTADKFAPALRHPLALMVLAAFFSLGCINLTIITEAGHSGPATDQISTVVGVVIDKGVWQALQADKPSSKPDYSDLQKKGWQVTSLEDGRIVTMTRPLTALEKLPASDWKLAQQSVGLGRIVTATFDGSSLFGADPKSNPFRNIFLTFDESDPNAPQYTYQASLVLAPPNTQPDQPPAPECSGANAGSSVDCFFNEIFNSPKMQKLAQAIKDAGPGKLILGATLPDVIAQATVNGNSGGDISGPDNHHVQWTLPADQPGAYILRATTGIPLSIDHIEVVQVVQDNANSVQLVAGKRAAVRVFAVAKNQAISGVMAGLSINGAGGSGPQTPLQPTLTAPTRDTMNPEDLGQSGTFILPPNLTAAGPMRLVATLTLPEGTAAQGPKVITKSLDVKFQQRNSFWVEYLRICYMSLQTCPNATIGRAQEFMQKLYPVADQDGIQYLPTPAEFPFHPWTQMLPDSEATLTQELRKFYNLYQGPDKPDEVVGWLPYNGLMDDLGSSDAVWQKQGGNGHVAWMLDTSSLPQRPDYQHLLAHEIGHNLGLRHTGTTDQGGACTSPAIPGPLSQPSATDWKWPDSGAIHVYGFDPQAMLAIGKDKLDVMTYCQPRSNIWISAFHYQQLFQMNLRPTASLPPAIASLGLPTGEFPPYAIQMQAAAAQEFLVVSGSVQRNGGSATLDPIYHLNDPGVGDAPDPTGSYCLRSSAAGASSDFCFTLSFLGQKLQPLDRAGFSWRVPYLAGTTRVALLHNGTELASMTRGSGAPAVHLTAPAQNESWKDSGTVSWSDSAGGNPLSHVVLYTLNGGRTWRPYTFDNPAANITIDTTQLPAGSQVQFRVLASDGLNTTQVDSSPVTLAGRASAAGANQPGAPAGPVGARPVLAVPTGLGQMLIFGSLGLICISMVGLLLLGASRRARRAAPQAAYPSGPTAQPPGYTPDVPTFLPGSQLLGGPTATRPTDLPPRTPPPGAPGSGPGPYERPTDLPRSFPGTSRRPSDLPDDSRARNDAPPNPPQMPG